MTRALGLRFRELTASSPLFAHAGQMVIWRMLGLALAAIGTIWAGRCLGPEKLGVSGIIITTAAQLALLVEVNQTALLVRHYKTCEDDNARFDLVSAVFSFRTVAAVAFSAITLTVLAFLDFPREWWLGIFAAFPYVFFMGNQPTWILQGQENVPAGYKTMAVQSSLSFLLYLLFFRPGVMGVGSDMVVQAVAVTVGGVLGWIIALRHFRRSPFQWRNIPKVWPMLAEGRWLILSGLVIYVYANLEAPMVGYLYSLPELGCYRTAINLVNAFQAFLTMVPILLYPRFIEWNKHGHTFLWERQKKLALAAVAIAVPICAVTFVLAPTFYKLTYGVQFIRAAFPFAVLVTSKFMVVLNGFFAWGLLARREDKKLTLLMTGVACVSLLLNLVSIPRFGMLGAAWVNLLSETLIFIGAFLMARPGPLAPPPEPEEAVLS